jgi:phenylalanyl-tRNA synthetase alpha subunit
MPRRVFSGKDGLLTARLKALGSLSPEARSVQGKALNQIKQAIEAKLALRQKALEQAELDARLSQESIDVTLPGRGAGRGGLHPVTLTIERVEAIFRSIGFDVADGPEIEQDFFNFTALNTPDNHPARSMHDTFYIEGDDDTGRPLLLRTHTSPMQIRYARMHSPPIKVIAPGKTYRVDSDATHSPMFHQVEGMWIDEDVSFADLKNVYTEFLRRFFERDDIDVRFRPSYFPFTEPSAEIDMRFAGWAACRSMARGVGVGPGASECRTQHRARSRAIHRICLWLRDRAPGHAPLWCWRPAALLRQRSSIPRAVQGLIATMKFSERWLRTYADPALSSDELAHVLTMAGLEVEERSPVAPPFSDVIVAQVVSVERHPNADKLNVCQVDVGTGTMAQIVCGAPNVAPGLKVPCALPGAELPGGMKIGIATMRGVESAGMLCSARELGLSEDHGGLLVLPADLPVGGALRDSLGLDDLLWLLKLTPNLAHCMSVTGIAREVSALTGSALSLPGFSPVEAQIQDRLPVSIEAPDLCGRFSGRVIRGVNARATAPHWMRERLERSGQRSISALVDISNYVMLEIGRPSHVFDLAKIHGGLSVRWGRAGEQLKLLNGQTVDLGPDADGLAVGVIADQQQVESLAGIMGGDDTAVSLDTTDIYLEAAFWWPQLQLPGAPGATTFRLMPVSDSSEGLMPRPRSSISSI